MEVKISNTGKQWEGNGYGYCTHWTATLDNGAVVGEYWNETSLMSSGWILTQGEKNPFAGYGVRTWRKAVKAQYS